MMCTAVVTEEAHFSSREFVPDPERSATSPTLGAGRGRIAPERWQ